MFKKKPTIKPLAPLRSSDRRKLADAIINDYHLEPPPAQEEEQTTEQKAETAAAHNTLRNSILPDNARSARFTTTQGPDLKQASGTVYVGSHDGEEARILWFQMEGRMYPTVYTLWKNPNIVPLLHTPEMVVQKLRGGADLMTPGLARGPPFPSMAKKDSVVAVASLDCPSVPVMVGLCEIDVFALGSVAGAKGHAVRNLHWTGDEAWGYGASGRAGQSAPEEIEGWSRVLDIRGLTDGVAALDPDDQDIGGGVALEKGDALATESVNGLSGGAATVEGGQDEIDVKEMTQKEIDDAFRNAFLFGVHKHKSTNPDQPNFGLVFPLSQSFVVSSLINPFLPAFTPDQEKQLQMKKTSWKNVKKFIKSLDKEKIIKSKEKDGHETIIIDIDFEDEAILNFKPYPLPKKDTTAGTSQGRNDRTADAVDTADDSVGQKLRVLNFFKPTAKLSPLFATTSKQLFAPPEVREIITQYIENAGLISETNKRLVKLDPTLANAVFDGSRPLDTEVLAKGTVPRDALIDRVLHSMSHAHAIVRSTSTSDEAADNVKPRSGAAPKIQIILETRSGNKTVTKVSGLEPFFVRPRLLADELRKACAGSTSVEPRAGAAKKHEQPVEEVMVQGPQRDAVVRALERRGVDKRWVEVLDRTKSGKKR